MSLDPVVPLFPIFVAGFTDLQFLGAGGLAYVYTATGLGYRFRVALKILKPEFRKNLFALARFDREAELHKLFHHPYIVQFFEIRHAFASCPAIVMDLVDRTLKDLVDSGQTLSWPRICRLGRQLASAIAEVHKKDIIHRDIKLENVGLVNSPLEQVKLLDFGIAKRMPSPGTFHSDRSVTDDTAADERIGSPAWMSPGRFDNDPCGDKLSDIYALGLVLYNLLAGKHPFGELSAADYKCGRCSYQPTPIQALRPDIPGEFARLVMRCLEKERAARPSSAEEVAEIFERLEQAALEWSLVNEPRVDMVSAECKSEPIGA